MVNAQPVISGRYPNLGPEILVDGRHPARSTTSATDVFEQVKDGDRSGSTSDTLYVGDEPVGTGRAGRRRRDRRGGDGRGPGRAVGRSSRRSPPTRWSTSSRSATLLLDGVGVPDIATRSRAGTCCIVVRGYDYRDDLGVAAALHPRVRPVLIGVDGGADALRRGRLHARPDRRRHGLGLRRRRCAAAPRWSCTPTATAGRPGWSGCSDLGVERDRVPGRGHQRGHRDAAGRRRRAPS